MQVIRAAIFDLLTSQCDRHAQNIFINEKVGHAGRGARGGEWGRRVHMDVRVCMQEGHGVEGRAWVGFRGRGKGALLYWWLGQPLVGAFQPLRAYCLSDSLSLPCMSKIHLSCLLLEIPPW